MIRLLMFLAVLLAGAYSVPAGETVATNAGPVYIIPIVDVIDDALVYVIRRGLNEAMDDNAAAIVFDFDTPGGRLDSAEEILNMLRDLDIPTYSFVNPNAISAGAIIAMGTDHIYMAPGSKIGDALPIMISLFGNVEPMPESIEEKSVSYVAAMIRAAAQHKGHDPQLAEAMVRRDSEYKIGDEVISKKGRLLTLTNKDAERKVGPEKRTLLSEGTVADLDALLATIGHGASPCHELSVTMAEEIARFIESFSVIILGLGLLGLYIEFKTPGFGLPGILGIILLAVWFWGYNIAGLAGMEEVALFVLGLALLVVEILFIPGFGFVGFGGILLMAAAIFMAMVEHYPGGPWWPTPPQIRVPLTNLGLAGILSAIGLWIAGRYLPRTQAFHRLVLESSTARSAGFAASSETSALVGRRGIAETALRPAGVARFDTLRLNVVSRGGFIEAGAAIVIAEAHGNRIIVELSNPL
jgi:membrane-bound serine protease (ClpP class)